VSLSFDGKKILDDVSLSLPSGAIIGVVGPNGAGKSTLMSILRGELQPDAGEVKLGETVDIGYVSQDRAELDAESTVFEAIAGHDESEVELGDGQVIDARLFVASFHFRGADQQKLVGLLSGGERNRVHLARMLKSGCNVLMLDEPTNDLDVEVLSNLENALLDFLGTAVVISHDRWFLNKIASHLLVFEGNGKLSLFEGSLEEYETAGCSLSGKRPKGAGFISLQD
jgi:energy-dependent translational throttle protein EttA